MSAPRDHSVDGRYRAGTAGTSPGKPVRDPTESLAADDGDEPWNLPPDDGGGDDDDLDPLSRSQAPMGTRDRAPRNDVTRIESPAGRNRTPAPPAPAVAPDSGRKSRPSRPPANAKVERPEERTGTILGSYRIGPLLGKGGMGFVYKAEHVKLGRAVAIKLLRADYAKRRDSVARFVREAQTVNKIRHRNIVDVPDIVELGDGTTFIVMELLEGQSLGKWSRAGFSVPRALALLVQICDGLAAAHAVGVIHRDLKPDNVIVVPTGDGAELIKLLDFGVAKLVNREDDDIGLQTQAGSVIGTPAYMSPEQAGGLTVDGRADIYSLGAIMYEMFCGQPMFKGRSFGEFVRKHLNEIPVPPRQTPGGAAIDDRLEAVILRCLEKDPARRYPSLIELRDELLHLLGSIETNVGMIRDLGRDSFDTGSLSSRDLLSVSARSGRRSGARAQLTPPPDIAPLELPAADAMTSTGPRRWPWIAAGLVVVGAGAAVVIAIALGGSDPSSRRPAARKAAPPAPEVTALGATAPEPRIGRIIEVRFDAEPGGDVYDVGSATPRCPAPCTVTIDTADGGAATHRNFVVKLDGYADQPVTVSLDQPQPSVSVTMTRIGKPRADGEPAVATDGDGELAPKIDDQPRVDDKPRTDDRPRTEPKADDKPKVDDPPKVEPKVDDPPKVAPKADDKPKADDPPKTDKKPIDPTDTIDPFR